MSDTQESPVGCFPCCSWFKGKARRTEGEDIPLVETISKSTVLSATKALLQVTAAALKFVPIPNLDQIPSLLLQCIDIYESVGGNEEKLEELRDVIQQAHNSIFRPLQSVPDVIPDEIKTITEGFRSDVNRRLESIKSIQHRNLALKVISSSEEINKLRTRIQEAIVNFNTSAITLNLIRTVRLSIDAELSKLPKAEAEYTAVKSKSECLPDTRARTQESILNHLRRPENRFVWLRGSPGTGKTAILISVASALEERRVLAASFFWDKNQASGLDSVDWFPSTLARQLAEFSPKYESTLVRRLRQLSLSKVRRFPLERQMETLILRPMDELKELWSSVNNRPVIVLDGLDECGDFEALKLLMKLVLMLDKLPSKFAVLVSSRPESPVVSAWGTASCEVPREDLDALLKDDHFHTVRRMVEEGLKDAVESSSWKPSPEEYDAFARACRELPVLAALRVRDVCYVANRGSTFEKEFLLLSDIRRTPKDLDAEYLRILRRAITSGPTEIPQHVFSNYRQVIGTVIAARRELSVNAISHLLEKTPEEIRGILKPISSIVDLPSDGTEQVKFYHATAKEFLTGKPKGGRKNEVFFIKDTKGYFLGLHLLNLLNNGLEQFDMPTDRPLGDRNKWDKFIRAEPWKLPHIHYATNYLFYHLDPSQLSSKSGELWNEFDRFLSGKLLSFLVLYSFHRFPDTLSDEIAGIGSAKFDTLGLSEEAVDVSLSRWAQASSDNIKFAPWHIYRSSLPFSRPSSMIHKLYAHLSDPITIFSISGEFTGRSIPLSEDAQHAVQARMRKISDDSGLQPDYEAELLNDNIRGGIVACAALSQDGKYVALGFGNGAIEIADIDHSRTISKLRCESPNLPLVWIEFIHGDCRIAVEDNTGNITIFGSGSTPIKLDQLPTGPHLPVTMVSHDQSMIVRAPRSSVNGWYNDMRLVYVLEDPSVHQLTPPTPIAPPQRRQDFNEMVSLPRRRSIGFSPGGWYIGAFDADYAFIWSTESRAFIAYYHVLDFSTWTLNTCDGFVHSPHSYLIPTPVSDGRSYLSHDKSLEGSRGPDEEWLNRPFLSLTPNVGYPTYSSIIRKVPILPLFHPGIVKWETLWFNGQAELNIPIEYTPLIVSETGNNKAWYGDRTLDDEFFLPRSSKDGTRILLQGKTRAPIVVDISKVV